MNYLETAIEMLERGKITINEHIEDISKKLIENKVPLDSIKKHFEEIDKKNSFEIMSKDMTAFSLTSNRSNFEAVAIYLIDSLDCPVVRYVVSNEGKPLLLVVRGDNPEQKYAINYLHKTKLDMFGNSMFVTIDN